MNSEQYRAFTETLTETLASDPRVVGLVAAGSMAGQSHPPDMWSDHDFWLVVTPDAEAWFHTHQDWLPDSDQIALWFREPQGGFKALYRSGHLLEYAIFTRASLHFAQANDFRLLIDRDGLSADLSDIYAATAQQAQHAVASDHALLGQFLTNLLVGVGRYRRGEQLSGRLLITISALTGFWRIIPKHYPPEYPALLDNLDPLRRVEFVYPQLAAEVNAILRQDLEQAALSLLDLGESLLADRVDHFPAEAFAIVRHTIREA